ncbi:mycothiol transferase [Aquimarina mytili]|uniref:DUF664 domain-containing protein n=1 Tax=Aquimarina mytili TaxID=874423 RepID=A0A937D5Q9_9FLAO|nr:DUF664 domain-containing protein [Aquimarina mytili]MBL0683574.1 DUF664 domain-containing protein [Aquimarina mytili]
MSLHFFKAVTIILLFVVNFSTFSQTKKVSRDWTSFSQSISVKANKETKFKLQASVKVETETEGGFAGLWVRVDNTNGEYGFFDNMMDRPISSRQWKKYVIEGYIDEHSKIIKLGGLCLNNGKFYFDNFELFIQNEKGTYEKLALSNAQFENLVDNEMIPGWNRGISKDKKVYVKEFTAYSVKNKEDKSFCLMIEGKGIKNNSNTINAEEGFTPQIGTLISMLNNLSRRVESAVQGLDVRQTDHLLDDKANRIGALVMHLAAAEAYYQVYTFENRGFNDEEKAKWQIGLSLGDKAREEFKGKPISYYLDVYKEVRKKTVEELSKRNDEWLSQLRPGSVMNNHWAWFHVMEHQSSHLGQILMLKKRIPEEEKEKITLPKNKID